MYSAETGSNVMQFYASLNLIHHGRKTIILSRFLGEDRIARYGYFMETFTNSGDFSLFSTGCFLLSNISLATAVEVPYNVYIIWSLPSI